MGKKRGKDRNQKEEISVDLSGVTCTHIRKGIDHSLLKKISLDQPWNSCQTCQTSPAEKHTDAESETESVTEPPAVWMCLKCGHRGCGRFSENQHAIKHYETPRSDTHCLVLSLDNWSVWCYICDDDVHYSSTGQLAQLVSNIKKQAPVYSKPETSSEKVKEENSVLEEPVEKEVKEVNEVNEVKEAEKETEDPPKQKEKRRVLKQNGVLKKEAAAEASCGAVAVKGFSNLGNTCFFNAVLQNLSQTVLLRQLLNEVKDEQISLLLTTPPSTQLDPLQVQLPRPGSLTLAMCQLMNEVQQTQKTVVTPRELFTQVCKKAARFKGFQQQDSQELLRYLLDGMRAEESTRVTAGILEALKNSGRSLDAEQKKVAKEYEKNGGSRNLVDRVFGGEMSSTVMCKECRTISLVTEVFLDLSLPVADEAYRKKNQKKAPQQKSSVSEDDGWDSPTPLANGDKDMPTGAGSKYQQKKAKKQAKKQAKSQKRQQKQGAKLTLDSLTNQDTGNPSEAPPPEEQVEASTECEMDQANSQSAACNSAEQEQEKPADDADEEVEKESSEGGVSSNANRFSALTEEGGSTGGGQDGGEEEEDKEEEMIVRQSEEDGLAECVEALSLQAANEESVEAEQEDKESDDTVEYVVVNQDPELAFRTLASRAAPHKQECSVESCLYQFTEVEQLTQSNSLLCVTCTKKQSTAHGCKKNVYRDALKQMLISSPPPVLTLHLKRFQQVGYSVCKVNRHVQFPQLLDLAPFCSTSCKGVYEGEEQVLYSLYGIVEHSGTMRSGHYTAFVKTRPQNHTAHLNGAAEPGEVAPPKGSWFHISDSNVQPVTEAKVQNAQAYLLFYERIS